MWVGSSSDASAAAFGLPERNGSTSTRVSPSVSSKQAWPRKRMSTFSLLRFRSGVPTRPRAASPRPRRRAFPSGSPRQAVSRFVSRAPPRRDQRRRSGPPTGAPARTIRPPRERARARAGAAARPLRRAAPRPRTAPGRTARVPPPRPARRRSSGAPGDAREDQPDERAGERAAHGGADVGLLRGERQQHEHSGDHVDAEQVVLAVVAAANGKPVVHQPGAQQAQRRAVGSEDRPYGG